MLIARRVLIAGGPFGGELTAARVTAAIARGLGAGGIADRDLCPLEGEEPQPRVLLDALAFDARMLASRAVIIADSHLSERTLARSATFEIATRARQSGVPAYAVTASDELDRFDARILDLQVILEAGGQRALVAAGRELARLLGADR